MTFTGDQPLAMAEVMVVTTHHPEVTHLDAMAHMVVDGQVYPGMPRDRSSGPLGVRHGSADVYADGILTRGVLLDLAPGGRLPDGHPVTAADLDAAAARAGVDIRSGDAVIVPGGWDRVSAGDRAPPGMTSDAVRWMHAKEISVYGSRWSCRAVTRTSDSTSTVPTTGWTMRLRLQWRTATSCCSHSARNSSLSVRNA